jgi:hypothetical protein
MTIQWVQRGDHAIKCMPSGVIELRASCESAIGKANGLSSNARKDNETAVSRPLSPARNILVELGHGLTQLRAMKSTWHLWSKYPRSLHATIKGPPSRGCATAATPSGPLSLSRGVLPILPA